MSDLLHWLRTDFDHAPTCYGDSPLGIDTAGPCPAEVDVAVVGGGLLGLSTALEVAQQGRSVVVLEAAGIAGAQSGRSGGQLWPGLEAPLSVLVERFGRARALATWQCIHRALEVVHQRAASAGGCEFRPGLLLVGRTAAQAAWIAKEARLIEGLGIAWASYLEGNELRRHHLRSPRYHNGLYFLGDAPGRLYGHLNPRSYAFAVARLAHADGAVLRERIPVRSMRALPDRGYALDAGDSRIRARQVVLATGISTVAGSGLPRSNVPAHTVILCTEPIDASLAAELLPGGACFCDAADAAMHYGRLIGSGNADGRWRMAFGGADALGQLQLALAIPRIRRELLEVFPQLEGVGVETVWGGRCDLSRDTLPMLVNPAPGLYAASGFSGQGMVATTAYAAAISQALCGGSRAGFEQLAELNPRPYARNRGIAMLQAVLGALRAAH